MFRSKNRSIIIPQSEHARLAAMVAQLWGNGAFDRPALDGEIFQLAVLEHDRAYGAFDTFPVESLDDQTWLQIQSRGIEPTLPDTRSEMIILFHLRRLFALKDKPQFSEFLAAIDSKISRDVEDQKLEYRTFERTDRIVDFCDSLSFDFCFEEATSHSVLIFAKNNTEAETQVTYTIRENGIIEIDPWPLRVQKFSSFIIGYAMAGYPEKRTPVIIPFSLTQQVH